MKAWFSRNWDDSRLDKSEDKSDKNRRPMHLKFLKYSAKYCTQFFKIPFSLYVASTLLLVNEIEFSLCQFRSSPRLRTTSHVILLTHQCFFLISSRAIPMISLFILVFTIPVDIKELNRSQLQVYSQFFISGTTHHFGLG